MCLVKILITTLVLQNKETQAEGGEWFIKSHSHYVAD